jgi:hypothetical protein
VGDGWVADEGDVAAAVLGDRACDGVVERGRDDDGVDCGRDLLEGDLDLDGGDAAGAAAAGSFLVEEDEVLIGPGSAVVVDEEGADVGLTGRQLRAQKGPDDRAADRCVPALG